MEGKKTGGGSEPCGCQIFAQLLNSINGLSQPGTHVNGRDILPFLFIAKRKAGYMARLEHVKDINKR